MKEEPAAGERTSGKETEASEKVKEFEENREGEL